MKIIIIILMLVFSVSLVNAQLGYNNPNLPRLNAPTPEVEAFDNTTAHVNSSDYWDNLDTPLDIKIMNLTHLNISDKLAVFWNGVQTEFSSISNILIEAGEFTLGVNTPLRMFEDLIIDSDTGALFLGNFQTGSLRFDGDSLNIGAGSNPIELTATQLKHTGTYCNATDCYTLADFLLTNVTSIIYLPINYTVVDGTKDAGNSTSLTYINDGDTLNVSESAGANPSIIDINFTDVKDFNSLVMRVYYSGGAGHEIDVQLLNVNTGVYDGGHATINDMSGFAFITVNIVDSSNHIDSDGNVTVRLKHLDSGNPAHDLFIDYFSLVDGFTTITTTQHDSLSERDNLDNHPQYLDTDGTRNITGNLTVEEQLVANSMYSEFYYRNPTYSEDFLYTSSNILLPWFGAVLSSGTRGNLGAFENHMGNALITSSATINSGYRYLTGTGHIKLHGGIASDFVFRTPLIYPTAKIRMGFIDSGTTTESTDGLHFEIYGNQIYGESVDFGARSHTSSNYTLSNQTWYSGKIRVDSSISTATFILYNESGSQLWSDTISTNLPTNGNGFGHGFVATIGETNARNLITIDYMSIYSTEEMKR